MRLAVWLAIGALVGIPSGALADDGVAAQQAPRGTLVLRGATSTDSEVAMSVRMDGYEVPAKWLGTPLPVEPGRRIIRTAAYDANGAQLTAPHDVEVFVTSGTRQEVHLPSAEASSSPALVGGGVAVVTLGVGGLVWSGVSFALAAVAGEIPVCDDPACPESPLAPPDVWIGSGVASGLLGLGAIIGGAVMIANGSTGDVEWAMPEVGLGPTGGSLKWRF